MRSVHCAVLVVMAVTGLALRADVTIRYKNEVKPGSLPPSAGMAMPESTVLRMKGAKAYSDPSPLACLMDFSRQEITLIDAEGRRFAVVPMKEYGRRIRAATPALPGLAQEAMEALKVSTSSRQTGRTELILGIASEETETTITIDVPALGEAAKAGPLMKMVMHTWTAKPEEAVRLPALRELAAYSVFGGNLIIESLKDFPGLKPMLDELSKTRSVALKMQMIMYMPAIPSADSGPGAALVEMITEAVEISTAPIEDSVFQLPSDFRPAPLEDLMQSLATVAPRKAAAPETALPPTEVQAFVPRLTPLKRVERVWPEVARAQGVQGVVHVLVTVDPEGSVANVEVVSGPEVLRAPAIDAVRQWKFRPVIRNGRPVTALTDQAVDFVDEDWRPNQDPSELPGLMAAASRAAQLHSQWPRTPEQVLADLERDRSASTGTDRFHSLTELASAAVKAGALDKAAAYATELLKQAPQHKRNWNYGNAIHDGNQVLGIVALRNGDLERAKQHLLAAGRTPGSPQLSTFGPDQTLTKELLEKDEREVVLEYFSLCRVFWKTGGAQLDAWTAAVRDGRVPNFGASLLY